MTKQEAIKEWKELGIVRAEFDFSCGGDSMNDTTLNFYNEKDKVVQSSNLEDYFDNEIYKQVNFYEASDGHYQGEAGVVTIELDEESDDVEEHDFTYSKDSQAEYNEQFTETTYAKLTDEQAEFVKKNVSNMNGGEDGWTINYSRDFIMTDNDEKIVDELETLITDVADEYEFENAQGEVTDWWNFSTTIENESNEGLQIDGTELKIQVSRTFVVYQDSEW